MTVVLTALLWLLLGAILLLLAAIFAPVRIRLRAQFGTAGGYRLALRPFGGLGPRLVVADSRRKTAKKPKARRKARRGRSRWRPGPRRFARAAFRLIADLAGCLRLNAAALDIRFGTGDPAETGQVFGLLAPLIHGTAGASRVTIAAVPVFDRAVLGGRAALDASVTPARLVPPFVRFVWSAFGPVR